MGGVGCVCWTSQGPSPCWRPWAEGGGGDVGGRGWLVNL